MTGNWYCLTESGTNWRELSPTLERPSQIDVPETIDIESGPARSFAPVSNGLTLWEFFSEAFVPLQGLSIPLKPAHQEICNVIEDSMMCNLSYEFVVLNVAPRFGKTKICEASIMWFLGLLPDAQFIYTVYSAAMAIETSRYIQTVMRMPWYLQLFPECRLGDVQKAEQFKTTLGGQLYADGVGGSLTGRGAGMKDRPGGAIFGDDCSKPDEAQSQIEIEKLHHWFENTLKSRRNSSDKCPMIFPQQRLGPDDMSGYLTSNYPNKTLHLKFPAMVNGFSVLPETVSTSSLEDTKRNNPFVFASQYMQEPIIMGGNMIKPEWFGYFDPDEPLLFEWRMVTTDTAWKTKEANDWSVFQCWGKLAGKIYLIDQVRGKWLSPMMIATAKAFWEKHKMVDASRGWLRKMVIEDHSSGTSAIQQLANEGIPIEPIIRIKDKVTRLEDVLPMIATGRVYLPKGMPWLSDFLNECAAFRKDGNHKHDDVCDPLIDAARLMLGESLSCFDVMRPPGDPMLPKAIRGRSR